MPDAGEPRNLQLRKGLSCEEYLGLFHMSPEGKTMWWRGFDTDSDFKPVYAVKGGQTLL